MYVRLRVVISISKDILRERVFLRLGVGFLAVWVFWKARELSLILPRCPRDCAKRRSDCSVSSIPGTCAFGWTTLLPKKALLPQAHMQM